MQKQSFALAAMLLATIPVLSQQQEAATSQSDCDARFKVADINNDGLLTHTEIPNVRQMPAALAKERSLISRSTFTAACAKTPSAQAQQVDKPASASPESTGQTVVPKTKGQQQPQGPTGPLDTKSGGAPAESPQGQTPPGMQPAPEGSSKSTVDPSAKGR